MTRPRNSSKFAYLDTGSRPKLHMIRQQIRWANDRFPIGTLDGYCVGLPGAGLQSERHRDEYRSYGIPDDRQIMVDCDYIVHYTQKQYMEKLGYTGKIVCDELSNVVKECWSQDKKVDIIDYDDVRFLLPEHECMIRDASTHNVKIIILVITNRCNELTDYHEYWKSRLGLVKRYVSPSKGCREPVGSIQEGAIRTIAYECGYDVISTRYPGRDLGPPMLSCMLFKK